MSGLTIIQSNAYPHGVIGPHHLIELRVDRTTLAKRRWRGTAKDGREFGFDLAEPINHGAHFFADGDNYYVIEQEPEEVLEILLNAPGQAARIGWSLGNLHFPVQVLEGAVRVQDDPAVRQLLQREGIASTRVTCLFLPLSAGAHGHHHHG
jgi:urease accessory protein